jgi:hypothetical protein
VFDRCGPPTEDAMPAANTLFIGHPPPPFKPAGDPDTKRAVVPVRYPSVQGALDRHPLMANLRAVYDIGIDESFRLPELPPGTQRLLEAAGGQVLIAGLPRGAFTDVVMAFPLLTLDGRWNTRWPLEPSFVLFLRNVLVTLGNVREASADDVTLPGQEKLLRPGGAQAVRVRRPDGTAKSFERGPRPDFAYTDTGTVGVYEASWGDERRAFAVNLFPQPEHDESDLAVVATPKIGDQVVGTAAPRQPPRELWKLAVLLGLAAVVGEWWVYNRRVQI